MRLIIFANGWLEQPVEIRSDDVVIAADGGLQHILALGILPSVVIGDLDSITREQHETLTKFRIPILQYPQRKDHTDLELALKYARELAADEVIIVAALGARWDQTLANLLLPAAQLDLRIRLIDGRQGIHYLTGGETLEILGQPGDTVSLIPLGDEARGITTGNLEYPLIDETLYFGSSRGVSNVLLTEQASIHLETGRLACVVIHQQ